MEARACHMRTWGCACLRRKKNRLTRTFVCRWPWHHLNCERATGDSRQARRATTATRNRKAQQRNKKENNDGEDWKRRLAASVPSQCTETGGPCGGIGLVRVAFATQKDGIRTGLGTKTQKGRRTVQYCFAALSSGRGFQAWASEIATRLIKHLHGSKIK
jgi:hypothetical protein